MKNAICKFLGCYFPHMPKLWFDCYAALLTLTEMLTLKSAYKNFKNLKIRRLVYTVKKSESIGNIKHLLTNSNTLTSKWLDNTLQEFFSNMNNVLNRSAKHILNSMYKFLIENEDMNEKINFAKNDRDFFSSSNITQHKNKKRKNQFTINQSNEKKQYFQFAKGSKAIYN